MADTTRFQQKYDHRLRQIVFSTGNIRVALDRGVPRSTARGWLRSTPRAVVSAEGLDWSIEELQSEVLVLRRRNKELLALLRLFVVVLRVSGFSLGRSRLPGGSNKRAVLRAVECALTAFPISVMVQRFFLAVFPSIIDTLSVSYDASSRRSNGNQDLRLEDMETTSEVFDAPRNFPCPVLHGFHSRTGAVVQRNWNLAGHA